MVNNNSQKSFYGKARVEVVEGVINLWSYQTLVAIIRDGKAEVKGWYSNTTGRHIKEFLLQNGFEATSKKQILGEYS